MNIVFTTSCRFQAARIQIPLNFLATRWVKFLKITVNFHRWHSVMEGEDRKQPEQYKTITEGQASVYFPNDVFYNPVQEFNRDLTIAVISELSKERLLDKNVKETKTESNNTDLQISNVDNEDVLNKNDVALEVGKKCENGLKILEGLAASGLRSVRFALEIPGIHSVVANDYDKAAVDVIDKNIVKNNLEDLMTSSCDDAAMVMYKHKDKKNRFDVIDLDPYGTPSPFLDGTVQAVADGGLLCITCTDAAVLCGACGETCYSKYGAMSLKAQYHKEMALRIILQCIESHANRYSRYIVPLISLSIDFYFRVFVKVYTGQAKVKRSASKIAMVYNCTGCGSFSLQQIGQMIPTKDNNYKYSPGFGPPVSDKCEHCNSIHQIGGPVWADPICDVDFIDKVIKSVKENEGKFTTSGRIKGMLSMQKEELSDIPFYFVCDDIYSIARCAPMNSVLIKSALLNAGYRVSDSHAEKNAIKTDAPVSFKWDIIRTWVKDHPVSQKRLIEGSVVKTILDKECTHQISFEKHPDATAQSKKDGLIRFQMNPEKYWGPKCKAKRKGTETQVERTKRLQGRQSNKGKDTKSEEDSQEQT